jgi:hypothetical protein
MIKNYTSTVGAARSVALIEHRIVKFGADNIIKTYTDGKISGLCFTVKMPDGRSIPFQIPARVAEVEQRLFREVRKPRPDTRKRIAEQAERTAWKLLSDWVDVQLSLVELGQVEFMEVFLSYAYDPSQKRTFYERIKEQGFKLLEGPK